MPATKIKSKWSSGNLKFTDNDGNEILQLVADDKQIRVGGSAYLVRVARIALAAVDTGGGVFSWVNPESSAIIIERIIIDVTTKTTAACTIDVGTTAVNGTTSSDNLIDGLDVGTAAGTFDNINDAGTNGKSRQKIASGKWVTASVASGASAGLVGYAYIFYTITA